MVLNEDEELRTLWLASPEIGFMMSKPWGVNSHLDQVIHPRVEITHTYIHTHTI